jgi:hypothetical protein
MTGSPNIERQLPSTYGSVPHYGSRGTRGVDTVSEGELTALSFNPNNKTSSINVNLGILLLSASSWKSRGSYATFPPAAFVDEDGFWELGFGVDEEDDLLSDAEVDGWDC